MEEQHNLEKREWLNKLDKITDNYKTYAESYQNYTVMKDQFDSLQKEMQQNSHILNHYEGLIRNLLTDLLSSYKKINYYLNSDKLVENSDLAHDYYFRTNEDLKDKLAYYNSKIDQYTFEDLYKEVLD